jgi:hypothetical protein
MNARTLLLSASLLLAACAAEGEIRTANDPFKGPVRGFALYLDPGHYTAVDLIQSREGLTLGVLVVQRGVSDAVGKPGEKAQCRVGNQVLTLTHEEQANPVANVGAQGAFTQWQVHFKLTPAEADILAAAPLTDVQVTIAEQSFPLHLDAAQSARFHQNIVVMTQK